MDTPAGISRRTMLRVLAGAPLLPLLETTALSVLGSTPAEAANAAAMKNNRLTSVEFIGMDAPMTDAERAVTTVKSGIVATYDDGSRQTYNLAYKPLFITGDEVPDGQGGMVVAGGYRDINNNPIVDRSAPDQRQFFSDCPDGYSLIKVEGGKVPGVKGNTVFAVVQFEYTSRHRHVWQIALADCGSDIRSEPGKRRIDIGAIFPGP